MMPNRAPRAKRLTEARKPTFTAPQTYILPWLQSLSQKYFHRRISSVQRPMIKLLNYQLTISVQSIPDCSDYRCEL